MSSCPSLPAQLGAALLHGYISPRADDIVEGEKSGTRGWFELPGQSAFDHTAALKLEENWPRYN